MENPEFRRQRKLRYLKAAIDELNRVLEACDYNPDSATTEEQVIAGMVATASLLHRELTYPRP